METPLTLFKKNKWIKIVLVTVFFQQILVASGTYFLGKLSGDYPSEGFRVSTALLLFICILLPGTIVHYWVSLFTARANKLAQRNYLNQYMDCNYNHPTHWRNESSKHQRHDIMCREGQECIRSSIYFFVDLTSTGLNIILNTAAIILVTNLTLGSIIIVAGFLGLYFIHLSENGISKTSRDEILANNQVNAHLSRSWDNIIIGNSLFFHRWKEIFNQRFTASEEAALQAVKKRDWAISIAGLITNGLVLGCAMSLAWFNRNSAGFVLSILVMLPRCLQIVMHIQIIQSYLAQWKSLREKLVVTLESLTKFQPVDLSSFIQKDLISINGNGKEFSIQHLEKFLLTESKSGRFTISGPNGAGKSSLLLSLKNTLNSAAVYLPVHHQLVLQKSQLGLSSGEIALAALKDLQEENYKILLLDEWDANLSEKNRISLDKIIETLSLDRVVIEVRHHH